MTTNEDVLLREVDEELAQDKQLAAFKKYGPLAGIAFLAFLAAVAFFELRASRQDAARAEASEQYEAALGEGAGADALIQFANSTPAEGYKALATMRAAGTLAASGESRGAIEAYAKVYGDGGLPSPMRDLARVRAAYLALADGGSAADDIVSGVESAAFAAHAAEISGLSAMGRGDFAAAAAAFERAAAEPGTGVAARATSFLALAKVGAAGIPLEASDDPDDYLMQFGRALTDGTLEAPEEDDTGATEDLSPAPATTDEE